MDAKVTEEMPAYQGRLQKNLKKIMLPFFKIRVNRLPCFFCFFFHTNKIITNTIFDLAKIRRTCRASKGNNFGANLFKDRRSYSQLFAQNKAYRVLEQPENSIKHRFNIREKLFGS